MKLTVSVIFVKRAFTVEYFPPIKSVVSALLAFFGRTQKEILYLLDIAVVGPSPGNPNVLSNDRPALQEHPIT